MQGISPMSSQSNKSRQTSPDKPRRPYGSVKAEKEERRKRREILERFDREMAGLKKNNCHAEISMVYDDSLPKCWKCPECGTLNAPREMICVYCGLGKISEKEEGDGKKINA